MKARLSTSLGRLWSRVVGFLPYLLIALAYLVLVADTDGEVVPRLGQSVLMSTLTALLSISLGVMAFVLAHALDVNEKLSRQESDEQHT